MAAAAMGAVMKLSSVALDHLCNGWLGLALMPKLGLFASLCILGVATFAFAAKILGIIDIRELIGNLLKKGNAHE